MHKGHTHTHKSYLINMIDVKFMLLHDQKSEDSIKSFFTEVYELYIKILMNPFYEKNAPIANPSFDNRVKLVARRFL